MRQLALNAALVLLTLAGIAVLWELRGAVLIFFLSLGTSAALRPAIDQLQRWGLPKSLSLALTYLGCFATVVLIALAIAYPLASNVQQLAADFREGYEHVYKEWPSGNAFERAIARRLPAWKDLRQVSWRSAAEAIEVESAAPETPVDAAAATEQKEATQPPKKSWKARALQTVLGLTWGFFGSILNVAIVVVLSLYWSIDRVHFERLWLSLLDVEKRKRARETWRAIEHATGAYLQREAVQSLAAGLLLGAGFWFMGQPYPVLAAAVAALVWLVPWIGALMAVVLVTAIWLPNMALSTGVPWTSTALAAGYTVAVLLALEWLIEPRLFPRKRYNPILLVLVAVGLVDWLGLLGLLLAPPIAAAVQILGNQFLMQRTPVHLPGVLTPQELSLRMSTLEARIADDKSLSPETRDTVTRLNALVEQTRTLLGNGAQGDAPPTARAGTGQ